MSTSFTFESGIVCDVDIRIAPDFATTDSPDRAVDVAQRFVSTLDLASLPIQRGLKHPSGHRAAVTAAEEAAKDARAAAGSLEPPTIPYEAETRTIFDAVNAAIVAELEDNGIRGGVSIESRVSCE